MSTLKNFFLFCSGIDQTILSKCPSDENKYMGIGATIFFTGVLAFFSSAYALFTVFDSWIAAIVFGLFWGMMIFNLDRYIVSSMKSNASFGRDFLVAFPRLILAVLLALVISKPLELKIFEKEINAELIVMEQEVFKTQEERVQLRYDQEIADFQQEVVVLKNEIAAKTAKRDTLEMMAIQEADGTGGSKNKNLGPIYRAKKAKADEAQNELDEILASYLPMIAEKEKTISDLKNNIRSEIAGLNRENYGGLAARMDALDRLGEESQAIFWANIFVMLLFVAVETAPIFVKLISPRSPYDFLLNEHEHVFKMAHLEQTTLLSNTVKNTVLVDTQVGTHRAHAKVQAEKALIDEQLRKRLYDLKQKGFWEDGAWQT